MVPVFFKLPIRRAQPTGVICPPSTPMRDDVFEQNHFDANLEARV
jgi:hypothetical protein